MLFVPSGSTEKEIKCALTLFFKNLCNTRKPLSPPMRGFDMEQKNEGEHSGNNGGL